VADSLSAVSAPFASRYAIERELGRGATSIVYLAHDLSHDRMVAIKMLRPELVASASAAQFLREIRRTAQLHHPHIVPVLDSGESDGGGLYYVLPFMEGGTLRDRLKHDKQLPLTDVIAIGCAVASALDVAHADGLVHRDVKPENILFTAGEACLADFGIARALVQASGEATTSTGVVRGTPAYMSPEQASGDREYDGRSDIYSLACVLYEAIAGVAAFVGPTSQSVVAQRLVRMPWPLRTYRPLVPPELELVLERALAVAAADRYQTVAEFSRALAAVEPLLTRSSGTSHPVLATWGNQSTSGTTLTASSRRLSRPLMVAAALVVVAGATYALRGVIPWSFANGGAVADENRVVIAQFDVLDQSDTVWRFGLVDVLSRNFDGAGPLRTVPPSVAVGNWRGRADVASASALGRRTRAGLVVFGQLTRAGRDSVRLRSTLIDVARGNTFEADLRDDAQHIDRLADSLTMVLLRDLGRTRPIAAVPRASLGSTSLAALKLFLQGEQAYRANDYVKAREAYLNAIALDSSFALAYRRMRGVLRALSGDELDSLSFVYALRAGERNRGLSPRDSLLIVADSIQAAMPRGGFFDPATVGRLRRRFAALRQAAVRYPDDPEIQFELGEADIHLGERVGVSQRQALDAFLEAIRLDSAFRPAYYHAIELSLLLDGTQAGRQLAVRYDALNPAVARYGLVVPLLESAPRDVDRLIASTDTLPASTVLEAIALMRRWPDSSATAVRLSQRLLRRRGLTPQESKDAEFWLSSTLLFRGRLKDSYQAMTPANVEGHPAYFVQLAVLGAVPIDTVFRVADSWVERGDDHSLYLAISILAARRDSLMLRRVISRLRAASSVDVHSAASPWRLVGSQAALAHLALLRGDSATALRLFLAIPDSLCSWFCVEDRLTAARLLVASGRAGDAARYLDRHPPSADPTTSAEPMWMLERGRAAAHAGRHEEAKPYFKFVNRIWAQADADLRNAIPEMKSGAHVQRRE